MKQQSSCPNGHQFYKSSDCPSCPVCEQERKPTDSFLALMSAPARRALKNKGIKNLQQLAQYTEAEILLLHGIGKSSIPILRSSLQAVGLSFKK